MPNLLKVYSRMFEISGLCLRANKIDKFVKYLIKYTFHGCSQYLSQSIIGQIRFNMTKA